MASIGTTPGYYDGAVRRFPFIRDGADVRRAGPRSWRWTCRECNGRSWEQVTAGSADGTAREDLARAYELLEIKAREHAQRYHPSFRPAVRRWASSMPSCNWSPLRRAA